MSPQEPLTREEMEPLWRAERQVSWLNIAAMGVFLLASATAYRDEQLAWFARPLLAAVLVLLLAAAVLQIRALPALPHAPAPQDPENAARQVRRMRRRVPAPVVAVSDPPGLTPTGRAGRRPGHPRGWRARRARS